MKTSTLRICTVLLFIGLVLTGMFFSTGFGSLSSFGIGSIAEICPVGALESMLASKTLIPRVIVGLLVFFVFCLVLGRIFCGWICPVPWLRVGVGCEPEPPLQKYSKSVRAVAYVDRVEVRERRQKVTVQNVKSAEINDSEEIKEANKVRKGPFIILGATLLSSLIFGFPVFCLVCPVGLTFAVIIGAWSMFVFNEPSLSLVLVSAFLLIEIVFLRRWCHSFCPIGAVISLFSYFNAFLRPVIGKDCLKQKSGFNCNRCREVCPEGIDLNSTKSRMLLARCIKCRACADACPVQVIHFPLLSSRKESLKGKVPKGAMIRHRSFQLTVKDFEPVVVPLTKAQVLLEARRCIDCGACEDVCPQHTPIRDMMRLIREEKFLKAGKLLLAPGAMPEICGRVCPQDRLCRSVCPLTEEGGPVRIGELTSFCADYVLKRGIKPSNIHQGKTDIPVGIVGAGPAGLSCADVLVHKGIKVTVFDRNPEGGGLLFYGIPSFKLPKEIVKNRLEFYRKLGIEFVLNRSIESNEDVQDLLERHHAVLWANGATVPVRPEIPGIDGEGFFVSNQLLAHVNQGSESKGKIQRELEGKNVAIFGAGDSAMDCARTVLRLGASSAVCIARKPRSLVSANGYELKIAESEGVILRDCSVIEAVNRNDCGKITSVTVSSSDCTLTRIPTDIVISAWGFKNVQIPALSGFVNFNEDETIKTDSSLYAGNKIFAAGDTVLGPDLVTDAIAQGRLAADSIWKFASAQLCEK